MENISKNIENVKENIKKTGSSGNVELVVVTKTFPPQFVSEAIKCGIKHIGESRIQEALPKFKQLDGELNGIKKHFIGHLQTNKVKKAVENFDLIHSLDSLDLAKTINKYAASIQKIQECLIEIKVSNESSKTGVSPQTIDEFYAQTLEFPNILIRGLMIIPPALDNVEESRIYFRQGYDIFYRKCGQNKNFNILSMGMSGDYKIAIQEGSNMVRIGSAIFGRRDYGNR
ncbi:MAG: YggS family pyridoxal phosphate-dependent enzyme [Elusimicrobiota bacterium]|jgi:pyridoxal phosphate enzyme (YggS family)|nr:YggS family pyridoxal phosphate-dependent enzyme [Elusimicrobiota bacterium]